MENVGKRFNEGKLRWGLVDWRSMEDLVRVLEFGERKYGKDNWKKGLVVSGVWESMVRHCFAFIGGEDIDKESGESHLGHIMCNAMMLGYMLREKGSMDDRINSLVEKADRVNTTDKELIREQLIKDKEAIDGSIESQGRTKDNEVRLEIAERDWGHVVYPYCLICGRNECLEQSGICLNCFNERNK